MRVVLRQSAGFTLLEILIALLVLTIGLLGFAALQLSSVNNNQEAYFQTQALAVANDLASRMQANRDYINWDVRAPVRTAPPAVNTAVDGNIYSAPSRGTGAGYTIAAANTRTTNVATDMNTICGNAPARYAGVTGVAASITSGEVCSSTTPCTPKQTAAFDRWEICRSAVRYLPEGEVRVACRARTALPGEARLNPYFVENNPHEVFDNGGPRLLNGAITAAVDPCPPESAYSIAVYWTPAAASRGVGEAVLNPRGSGGDEQSSAVNPRCADAALTGGTVVRGSNNVRKACVVMDVLP